MSYPTFARHLTIFPTLSPVVHFQKRSESLPFPLNQKSCRTYSLARHAIWNVCHALGLKSTDTVLVPAYHHGSEIEALIKAGLQIRYYELNLNLEPEQDMLESLLSPDVRALYIIHYLGFPQHAAYWRKWCDDRGLLLMEDAAQAFLATQDGQPLGSFGHMGVFCLYKTYGLPDGAAIISMPPVPAPDAGVKSGAWRLFKRHFHWMAQQYSSFGFLRQRSEPFLSRFRNSKDGPNEDFYLGNPSTPPSMLTSQLLSQVADEKTAQRRRENYLVLLKHLHKLVPAPFASLPEGASPFAFPIEIENAKEFLSRLHKYGVIGFLFWLYNHPSLPVDNLARSRALRERIVALPVHQELTPSHLQQIVEAVNKAISI